MTTGDDKLVAILCKRASGLSPSDQPEGASIGNCAYCGHAVLLAPSSQTVIAKFRKRCSIICTNCYTPSPSDTYVVAPGAREELLAATVKTKGPPS